MHLPTLDPSDSVRHDDVPAGFALLWTLFTLVLVSLLATSGFLLTRLNGLSAHAFSRTTDAFYIADGGLATAVAGAAGPSPTQAPVGLGSGVASVTFEQLLDLGPGEKLFRVESSGRLASNGISYDRTVGRLIWVASPPRVPGALVVVGAVVGGTPSGRISGFDVGGGGCVGQPTPVAGIAYWNGPPVAPSAALSITGSPALRAISPATSVARETGIRWSELIAPFGPTPDATVPPDPWPAAGVAGGWPLIRVAGSATLGAGRSGQGALVVEGDLTVASGFAWQGLIVVGGAFRVTGSTRVRGAVMSGLAGLAPTAADLGSQPIDLEFDSCAVAQAASRLTAPSAVVPGTWYEVW